jgi:hypothetical protein
MSNFVKVFKHKSTGTGVIADTFALPSDAPPRKLCCVTAHFSADPGAENLTITLNAGAGALYDTLLKTQAMSGITDFVWYPDGDLILESGDALDFAMAGAAARVYGIQVTMREVT